METEPSSEEKSRILSNPVGSKAIDTCMELLASGRPIDEILTVLRTIPRTHQENTIIASRIHNVHLRPLEEGPQDVVPEPIVEPPVEPITPVSQSNWRRPLRLTALAVGSAAAIMVAGVVKVSYPPSSAATPPPVTPVETVKAPMAPTMPQEQRDALRRHGDDLMGLNMEAAREFYAMAAVAGDPEAAFRLGATYDPAFLSQLRLKGEADKADYWYRYSGLAN